MVSKYTQLVNEDIKLLLYHKRELALCRKKSRGDSNAKCSCFSEREKIMERYKFSSIMLNKLNDEQESIYTTIWRDLEEVGNSALVVKPFRDPG